MNKAETTKVLSTLRAVWSNEEITPEKIEVYHWVIGDYGFDAMMTAARVHIGRGKFFPKPAELLEIVAETEVPALSAGDAWEIVMKQISRNGYDNFDLCDFGSDAILAAVKAVGWRRICRDDMTTGYIRRDFDQALQVAQDRQRREVQSGAHEALPASNVTALPRRGVA